MSDNTEKTITHKPYHGKLRTVDGVEMRYDASDTAWVGIVDGKELRVHVGTYDDHVEVMRVAIKAEERETQTVGPDDVGTLDFLDESNEPDRVH